MLDMPETVTEAHDMRCPNCGEDHSIDVAALVWTRLTPHGADIDLSHDGSQEWEDVSPARCDACGHVATVADFQKALDGPPWHTCPDQSRFEGDDMLGCGERFQQEPDAEGWVDCPHCGLAHDTNAPNRRPDPEG